MACEQSEWPVTGFAVPNGDLPLQTNMDPWNDPSRSNFSPTETIQNVWADQGQKGG